MVVTVYLKRPVRFIVLIDKYSRVLYGRMAADFDNIFMPYCHRVSRSVAARADARPTQDTSGGGEETKEQDKVVDTKK